ncbi:dephospho-CoA kinase [uncultured Alistipes sp.]|uniref:dephospho-CoA kinase n=1 Tax=uncultured Alistipes sp. TaxID=538949 RepID=UPI0028042660|nr:dephospho-CoA kinase [uncultured Alistipes sp.]
MKVGITGGIGSGKSTVCRLFARRGVAVYDSDSEAKRLMTESVELRQRIAGRFGAEAYAADGGLNRSLLAARVFTDPQALADLNAMVHPAVMADFAAWAERQSGDYVVLESAILFEAGLEHSVDRTVAVLAPLELRLERTCRRDGCDREAVRRRMAAQMDDDTLCARADYTVVNIREEDLEPTVAELDRRFKLEVRHRHEA